MNEFELVNPNPEYLIKSIAEQGYTLETSLADLIDNSIAAAAKKIEIIIRTDEEPFMLYLADNGDGMSEEKLKINMQFPSKSLEINRTINDLGRFGLGLKTASFSQTRKFTVLSRAAGTEEYHGRTWDVEYLKITGQWRLLINSPEEIKTLITNYKRLSSEFLNEFEDYLPNTVVIWWGLYKYESYIEDQKREDILKKEISEITSNYLSLVFHRFMELKLNPLQIRVNNNLLVPFNPFPTEIKDFRPIEYKQRRIKEDTIKIEGFILPARSIDEAAKGLNMWSTQSRGLMDMEGIYIYRADRIILFGTWLGLIKKTTKLQLARLRVEVGNKIDHLLHLNVAKSQIVIPHELRLAFENYIDEIKIQAEREFYNRGTNKISSGRRGEPALLFKRISTNQGTRLALNADFPIISTLKNNLQGNHLSYFKSLLKMIDTVVNKIRQTENEIIFTETENNDEINLKDIKFTIDQLLKSGYSPEDIKNQILPTFGFKVSTLPSDIFIMNKNEK